MRSEIHVIAAKMKLEEFDFRHLDKSWVLTFRRERTKAFQEALELDKLTQAAKDPEIPDEVEQKICELAADNAIISAHRS